MDASKSELTSGLRSRRARAEACKSGGRPRVSSRQGSGVHAYLLPPLLHAYLHSRRVNTPPINSSHLLFTPHLTCFTSTKVQIQTQKIGGSRGEGIVSPGPPPLHSTPQGEEREASARVRRERRGSREERELVDGVLGRRGSCPKPRRGEEALSLRPQTNPRAGTTDDARESSHARVVSPP